MVSLLLYDVVRSLLIFIMGLRPIYQQFLDLSISSFLLLPEEPTSQVPVRKEFGISGGQIQSLNPKNT
jgi:hypothetical protein